MSEPLGPVVIGAREIYDQVVRLVSAVDRLAEQHTEVRHDLTDHEVWLRSLERARWPLPALSMLIAVGALVLAFVRTGL